MARKQQHDRQSDEQGLEEFLGALALDGRSMDSMRAYRRDLAGLLAGRSPSSINRAIGAARSFPFVTLLEPQAERKTRRAA
jgi:hypothetical protein